LDDQVREAIQEHRRLRSLDGPAPVGVILGPQLLELGLKELILRRGLELCARMVRHVDDFGLRWCLLLTEPAPRGRRGCPAEDEGLGLRARDVAVVVAVQVLLDLGPELGPGLLRGIRLDDQVREAIQEHRRLRSLDGPAPVGVILGPQPVELILKEIVLRRSLWLWHFSDSKQPHIDDLLVACPHHLQELISLGPGDLPVKVAVQIPLDGEPELFHRLPGPIVLGQQIRKLVHEPWDLGSIDIAITVQSMLLKELLELGLKLGTLLDGGP